MRDEATAVGDRVAALKEALALAMPSANRECADISSGF